MIRFIKPFVILSLLLIGHSIFSQEKEFITGTIIDVKTNEPVVFANIRIKDRALGVITNIDGSFRIPLEYKEYGDIIEISSMGYQTKEILISELVQKKLNLISLDPDAINLQEAVVSGKDKSKRNRSAKQIVQRAIDAIPKNYPSTSFSTVGYYRDYQLNEGEYINLNEAILEVFDQGFNQLDDHTSETRLFNFDLNVDFKQDSMARTAYDYESNRKIINKAYLDAYGGNEFRILKIHDAIRNYNVGAYDFVGNLKTDFIKNHIFLRSSDTSIENEAIYTIKFWVLHPNFRANGTIYIAKSDFAIHKLEYAMYDDKKWNKDRKKNKHGHRQKVIFDITTDYRRIHDKMYLNYISFHNNFVLNIPPVFKVDFISVDLNRKCFVVEYNNIPETKPGLLRSNYTLKFKDNGVKLKTVKGLKNKILLYPDMKAEKIGEMISTIISAEKRGVNLHELIEIKIRNVRDTKGNLINEWTQKEYQQYREFFVQRIKPDSRAPSDGVFMNKRKPLFVDQTMFRPKDYKEYWKNTPLPSFEN